jgi:hypothetical protein
MPLTPIGQQADPLVLAPRDPVELPDHDRIDLAVEDRPLHLPEGRTIERRATLAVFVPADRRIPDAVIRQPTPDLGPLAVDLLAARGDPAVAGIHGGRFRFSDR